MWGNEMTNPTLLAAIDHLSQAIGAEPDHDKRQTLKQARELVRVVVWGRDVRQNKHTAHEPHRSPISDEDAQILKDYDYWPEG